MVPIISTVNYNGKSTVRDNSILTLAPNSLAVSSLGLLRLRNGDSTVNPTANLLRILRRKHGGFLVIVLTLAPNSLAVMPFDERQRVRVIDIELNHPSNPPAGCSAAKKSRTKHLERINATLRACCLEPRIANKKIWQQQTQQQAAGSTARIANATIEKQ